MILQVVVIHMASVHPCIVSILLLIASTRRQYRLVSEGARVHGDLSSYVVDHVDALLEGENTIFIDFDRQLDRYDRNLSNETAHHVRVLSQVCLEERDSLQDRLVEQVEAHAELNNYLHCLAQLLLRDAAHMEFLKIRTPAGAAHLALLLPEHVLEALLLRGLGSGLPLLRGGASGRRTVEHRQKIVLALRRLELVRLALLSRGRN